MEECRDDIKSKLYYMDEILHKISSMSQAENEKQLDDMTPSILKSVGKYTAQTEHIFLKWIQKKRKVLKIHLMVCVRNRTTDTESAGSSRMSDAELGGNIYPEEKYHHL